MEEDLEILEEASLQVSQLLISEIFLWTYCGLVKIILSTPFLTLISSHLIQVCKSHSGILGKGLALSHSPTILEALEGNLPLHLQTNEHSFLEDFITCVQNSSGGRLAR